MKFKMIKAALAGLVLTVSGFANAGLIIDTDRDSFIDDTTGLEWFDFGNYNNTSLADMNDLLEADLTGWRYASYSEAQTLFSNMFSDYLVSSTSARFEINQNVRTALEFFNDLIEVIGVNNPNAAPVFGPNSVLAISLGNVTDGTNVLGSMSINGFTSCDISGGSSCASTSRISFGSSLIPTNIDNSWLIVKQDVPEPSTLAILALGLIGLGARRFKK